METERVLEAFSMLVSILSKHYRPLKVKIQFNQPSRYFCRNVQGLKVNRAVGANEIELTASFWYSLHSWEAICKQLPSVSASRNALSFS